jgi:predicted Zn-dependent peptidase
VERLRRTEIGGIPVWWAPSEGPVEAGLAFRVGMADEPVAKRGISHLAEHLALFELGRQLYQYNGVTTDNHTIFDVKGSAEEVVAFLQAVARGLADPPLERFDDEVNVLRVEGLTRSNGMSTHLRQLRYGARTYGLRGKRELGLRSVTPEDLKAWATAHFTRENAVLWMTCEPPADLALGLPSGERRPMPSDAPIPRLQLPAFKREEDPVVAATFVADQADAETLRITAQVARERLYNRLRRDCALIYDVDQGHGVVGPGRLHISFSIDSREEDAGTVLEALLETLGQLGEEGPTADELAFEAEQTRRYLEDPAMLEGRLADAALDELNGVRPVYDEEMVENIAALTPGRCAQALRSALDAAIVVAPESLGADTPAGLTDYAVPEVEGPPPEGPRLQGARRDRVRAATVHGGRRRGRAALAVRGTASASSCCPWTRSPR